ncbi:MAG: helix-turn-helix transcriptional regulator [Burkholderiales bacterium]|nr:helix-turn-helix transcriptional regulator [Opitutaceae bacterium]
MNPIAARIRALRRQQKRPLRDIADRCGFTTGLLSKIETGKTTPPIATLAKIAAALGVALGDLVDGGGPLTAVFQSAASRVALPATLTEKGYGFHLLASGRAAKTMQPILFEARRGEIRPGPLSHEGEEFVYVLEGRMNYRVGATTYTLGPGDSLYFDPREEHDLEPLTAVVRYLAVLSTPPAS